MSQRVHISRSLKIFFLSVLSVKNPKGTFKRARRKIRSMVFTRLSRLDFLTNPTTTLNITVHIPTYETKNVQHEVRARVACLCAKFSWLFPEKHCDTVVSRASATSTQADWNSRHITAPVWCTSYRRRDERPRLVTENVSSRLVRSSKIRRQSPAGPPGRRRDLWRILFSYRFISAENQASKKS